MTKRFDTISLMSDAKRGISASQLGRHIGMNCKTAWNVAHRFREAMREAKDIQREEVRLNDAPLVMPQTAAERRPFEVVPAYFRLRAAPEVALST